VADAALPEELAPPASLPALFGGFLKVSLCAFGGGIV
jgi:hypothetical protein